jgi:DNA ligase (NAD+)
MKINIEELMSQSEELLELTLSDVKNSGQIEDTLEILRDNIIKHNHLYYVEENPVITDFQYDYLFNLLKNTEKVFPEYITENSPTQNIAVEIQTEFEKAKHVVPMISLSNTYNAEDLKDFAKQLSKLLPEDSLKEYVVELKLDGIGISLSYENNKLIRAATRGNGITGENVTANAKTIDNIPQEVNLGISAEIRGEIVLPKKELSRINEERISKGESPFVNCRNAASGSMRQLDTQITKDRNLKTYFYNMEVLEENNSFKTYSEQIEFLKSVGFEVSKFFEICSSIDEVIEICNKMEKERNSFDFDIDGLVIKLNDLSLQKLLGSTEHHPRWAISYKFPAEKTVTKLESVTFQIGRTGVITPVAELKAVELSGATLNRATLHNFEDIERKDIKIGDYVEIERAGEVIPAVLSSLKDRRDGSEKEISIPKACPVCESDVIHRKDEVAYRCPNVSCLAQVKGRIKHYVSRQGVDIEGLGSSIIDVLVDEKILQSITDIYTLKDFEVIRKLEKIEGLGPTAISKLFDAIEKSKTMSLNRILHGLGVQFIGKKGAQILTKGISSLHDLGKKNFEELIEIEEIGPKTAESIIDFFASKENIKLLHKLEASGVNLTNVVEKNTFEKIFTDEIVVFTGSLENMTREEAENIVEKLGGKTSSSVSKNTTLLVYGKSAGSKKDEAESLDIKLKTEEEFLNMIPNELVPEKKTSDDEQLTMF